MAYKNAVRAHLSGTKAGKSDFDDDCIRPNALNRRHLFEEFLHEPVTSKRLGGAATGATGDRNCALFPETAFEWHVKGVQTILTPVVTAVGWDLSMDQTDNDGIEVTNGILSRCPVAFTVGTDGPFFFRVKLKLADVSGTDDCAMGFRKAEAYQAALDDYDEMAALNVISGDVKIETILNNAATTTTDTTDNWADAATKTLKVLVSKAGVVTYEIDGVAPTVTAAFSFDSGEVVVPFFYFLHTVDLCDTVELIEWEVGFQHDV